MLPLIAIQDHIMVAVLVHTDPSKVQRQRIACWVYYCMRILLRYGEMPRSTLIHIFVMVLFQNVACHANHSAT